MSQEINCCGDIERYAKYCMNQRNITLKATAVLTKQCGESFLKPRQLAVDQVMHSHLQGLPYNLNLGLVFPACIFNFEPVPNQLERSISTIISDPCLIPLHPMEESQIFSLLCE